MKFEYKNRNLEIREKKNPGNWKLQGMLEMCSLCVEQIKMMDVFGHCSCHSEQFLGDENPM